MNSVALSPDRSLRLPGLRALLAIDAATCLAMGALLVVAAAPLATLLGLPPSLLFWAGVLLLPCAVSMIGAAAMRRPAPLLVWLVIAGNAAWVAASLALAAALDPTPLGLAFVLVQAAAVAVLLVLEQRALAASRAR